MEACLFKFCGWEKFQGESKRYESTSWFRVQNTLWMHELWDKLDDQEFRAFIFLLSYVSQRDHKSGQTDLNFKTLNRMSGIPADILISTVRKLCELSIAELISDSQTCEPGERTVIAPCEPGDSTVLRTNERNERTNVTEAAPVKTEQCLWNHPDLVPFLANVPVTGQKAWFEMVGTKFLIEPELHKARAWWITNPERRKPGDTVSRFVNGWLSRVLTELEKSGGPRDHAPSTAIAKPAKMVQKRACEVAGYIPGSRQPMCKTHSISEPCEMRESWKQSPELDEPDEELKQRDVGSLLARLGGR